MGRCKNCLFFPYNNNKYIHIILRLYSDSFCTVGADDKWIDWLIDNFRLKRMLYMIRDSCLAD